MKQFITYVFLLCSITNLSTQAQDFVWAKKVHAEVRRTLTDQQGHTYIGGTFYDSIVIDTTTILGTGSIHSHTNHNAYLAKFDPAGTLLRVWHNTGSGSVSLHEICRDKTGNIYLMGHIQGEGQFGSFSMLSDVGIFSHYIAKLDPNGNFQWVKPFYNQFNKGSDIRVTAITCDQDDHLYIYGYIDGSFQLDTIAISASKGRLFFARLDPANGSAIWARYISGTAFQFEPIKILSTGNDVIISGRFGYKDLIMPGQTCIFDQGDTLQTSTASHFSTFFARYDQQGRFQWARLIDSAGLGSIGDMDADINGNIYLTGARYFAKYNRAGQQLWFHTLESGFFSRLSATVNGIYLTASFEDIFSYQSDTITSTYRQNAVILKTNPNTGALRWKYPLINHNLWFKYFTANDKGAIQYGGNDQEKLKLGAHLLYNQGKEQGFISLLADPTYIPDAHSTITGNIYNDTIADCNLTSEPGIPGFGLIALPGPYYTVADSQGNYSLKVDTGNFTVAVLQPAGRTFINDQTCVSSHTVSIPSPGQTAGGHNFPNRYTACTFLHVAVSDESHIECSTSHHKTVIICNDGTKDADSVLLTIRYPHSVFYPVSSSVPWSDFDTVNALMTFDVRTLPADSCLTIIIADTVLCNKYDPPYDDSFMYSLRLGPVNSCYSEDSIYNNAILTRRFIRPLSLSADTPIPGQKTTVYPNPTSGLLSFDGIQYPARAMILNTVGAIIVSAQLDLYAKTIDITDRPPGIYFVIINDQRNNRSIHKVIKRH